MEWHPIETAPKDGTRILLFREGWEESCAVGYWREDWYEFAPVAGECFPQPTHWQPLPPPPMESLPQQEREGGSDGVEVRQRAKPVKFRMQWGPGETEYASWLPVGAPTSPAWCPVHQHRKWCEHNGGVMGPNGWEAPHGVEGRKK